MNESEMAASDPGRCPPDQENSCPLMHMLAVDTSQASCTNKQERVHHDGEREGTKLCQALQRTE